MSLEKKLEAWTAAGLIDEAAAGRIRAYEDAHDRPYALWAVVGLGLFALGLGLMLIVAANWDLIPAWLKLGVHWLLTLAAAAAVWRGIDRGQKWLTEAALFVLAAFVLAGIALHSQVYQLVGPVWQALLLWFILAAPAVVVFGRTRVTGYLFAGMLLWLLGDLAFDYDTREYLPLHALAMAGPAAIIALSLLPRVAPRFADGAREVAVVVMLGGASLAHFAWADHMSRSDAADMAVRLIGPAIAAMVAYFAGTRWRRIPIEILLPLLVGPFVAVALATAIPHGNGWLPRFVGAIIFAGMWGWIAFAASRSGWRALFGIAIAAIAIRIFIVYFELFGTLATTGAGLMVGGVLLIALAFGWRRVFRMAEDAA